MSKLADIAIGWFNYLKSSERTRELMKQRLEICDTCPHKAQISPGGKLIMSFTNDVNNLFRCDLCNCPLGAMSSHPVSQCKLKLW